MSSGNQPASGARSRDPDPSLTIQSVADLLKVLDDSDLLDRRHRTELNSMQGSFAEPRALARELLQRNWLTPYQMNQLFRGQDLVLGPYVLLERLGEGGMGQVFKARHQLMERIVAIKVIRKDRLSRPKAVERFKREIKATAQLSHPNIVIAHDAAEVGDIHFLVMEYVPGTDLRKLVDGHGPLAVGQACNYIRQAALGLQHAHERGLVHRDIKPANLLVTADGTTLKVLDLGLARLIASSDEDRTAAEVTQEGSIMGTPDYMAPEQALESHTVDVRADIYSLGCTLYFILTGKAPFAGGTLAQKLVRHQREEPVPLGIVRQDAPAGLAALVAKMMAKRPQDRFQTPGEVAAALAEFCTVKPPVARPVPAGAAVAGAHIPVAIPLTPRLAVPVSPRGLDGQPDPALAETFSPAAHESQPTVPDLLPQRGHRFWLEHLRRHWKLAGAAAVILVVLVIMVVLRFRSSGPGTDPDDKPGPGKWPGLDNLEPIKAIGTKEIDWVPEGLVAVVGNLRGRHWGPVGPVAFSRDGKLVASACGNLICIWDAVKKLEGKQVLQGHTGDVSGFAFLPDNRLLSSSTDRTLRLWDVTTGKKLRTLEGHTDPVVCVAVSPDGTYALSGAAFPDKDLRLWDLKNKSKKPRRFMGHTDTVQSVAFSPDGKLAISSSADKTLIQWDVAKGKKQSHVGHEAKRDYSLVTFSTKGPLAFSHIGGLLEQRLIPLLWNAETGKQMFGIGRNHPVSLAFSHDGRRVAVGYGEVTNRNLPSSLVIYDADTGREERTFPGHPGAVNGVAFSPDGRRVVSGGGDHAVRLWDINDNEEVVPFHGHWGPVYRVALTKNGRYALTGGVDGTMRLWELPARKGQTAKELRKFEPGHPGAITSLAFSPDGRLALSGCDDARTRLWDVKTGKEDRAFPEGAGVSSVSFSPDGSKAISCFGASLRIRDIKTGKESAFDGLPVTLINSGACALDGKRFISGGKAVVQDKPYEVLHIWDLRSDKVQVPRFLVGEELRSILSVAVSPDGKCAIAGNDTGTVRLWNLKSQKADDLSGHGRKIQITGVAYTPDGTKVAASGADGKVIIWDVASKKEIQRWRMPGPVHAVTFADNQHLATANNSGNVYILRLEQTKKY